jgi:hypothetical protein
MGDSPGFGVPLVPKIPYPEHMPQALFTRNLIQLALLPLLLCACGTPEVLLPRSAAAPPGIDFSGQWKMRPESKRGQPRINEAINRTDGVDNQTIMREMMNSQRYGSTHRSSGETKGGLVGIFLKTGDALKISQTEAGIFVSFDRSVTRENRPINIGQADAIRVSGWDGNEYVVETLGEKGMKLTDRYSLSADRQVLSRYITLRSKNHEEVTIVQEFDRQED